VKNVICGGLTTKSDAGTGSPFASVRMMDTTTGAFGGEDKLNVKEFAVDPAEYLVTSP